MRDKVTRKAKKKRRREARTGRKGATRNAPKCSVCQDPGHDVRTCPDPRAEAKRRLNDDIAQAAREKRTAAFNVMYNITGEDAVLPSPTVKSGRVDDDVARRCKTIDDCIEMDIRSKAVKGVLKDFNATLR